MIRVYLSLVIGSILWISEVQLPAVDLNATVAALTKRTAAVLPRGWTATQTNQTIIVQRTAPVLVINWINVPGPQSGQSEDDYLRSLSFESTCFIEFRFNAPLSTNQLAEMQRQNDAALEKLTALQNQMLQINHKFDNYMPSNLQESNLVAQYTATKAAYRELPDYHFDDFSIYQKEYPPEMTGLIVFYSKKDSREFERVRKAVLRNVQAYEASPPNKVMKPMGETHSSQ